MLCDPQAREEMDIKLLEQTREVERDVSNSAKGCKQIEESASLSQAGSSVACVDKGKLDWLGK